MRPSPAPPCGPRGTAHASLRYWDGRGHTRMRSAGTEQGGNRVSVLQPELSELFLARSQTDVGCVVCTQGEWEPGAATQEHEVRGPATQPGCQNITRSDLSTVNFSKLRVQEKTLTGRAAAWLRPLLSRLPMRTIGCGKEGTRPAITCLPVCRPGRGLTELGNVQRPGEPKAGGSSQWPGVPCPTPLGTLPAWRGRP